MGAVLEHINQLEEACKALQQLFENLKEEVCGEYHHGGSSAWRLPAFCSSARHAWKQLLLAPQCQTAMHALLLGPL